MQVELYSFGEEEMNGVTATLPCFAQLFFFFCCCFAIDAKTQAVEHGLHKTEHSPSVNVKGLSLTSATLVDGQTWPQGSAFSITGSSVS